MRLVQYRDPTGQRAVSATDDKGHHRRLDEVETVYELALEAIETGRPIAELAAERRSREGVNLDEIERTGRLLPPLEHPVPTRCWITGSGLTHLGSGDARARMHAPPDTTTEELTDSRKLYRAGIEGGKPAAGSVGTQPEWFFRGNGGTLLGSGQPLPLPDFALDGGEEPEIVGAYVIADDGTPCRVGWALGNEYTDHVMERANSLYLAHAKLRATPIGPELLLGELPAAVEGISRIRRGERVIWERPFATGDANMSHHPSNLEYHHFKYPMFRRPGDVHLHFFGTSTISAADGVRTEPGDIFEISAPLFGQPLRNRLERVHWPVPSVRVL